MHTREYIQTKNKFYNFGFTLVELLTVITIIGLLASLIITRIAGSKEKARIASAQQFSQSISHGLEPVIIFDEGDGFLAMDGSGNGNNGKLQNGASWVNGGVISADQGKRINLNVGGGSNDYINIQYSSSLNFSKNNALTITAWIYPVAGGGNQQYIIDQSDPINSRGLSLRITVPGRKLNFNMNGVNNAVSDSSIKFNKWNHVAVTYKGGDYNRVYIDGKLEKELLLTPNVLNSGLNITIGNTTLNPGGVNSFKGYIDEIHMYDQALTSSEIKRYYAAELLKRKLVKNELKHYAF